MTSGQFVLAILGVGAIVNVVLRLAKGERMTYRMAFSVVWPLIGLLVIVALVMRLVGGKDWDKPAPNRYEDAKRAEEEAACPRCHGKVMPFEEVAERAELVLEGVQERREAAKAGATQAKLADLLDEDIERCARITLHYVREHK